MKTRKIIALALVTLLTFTLVTWVHTLPVTANQTQCRGGGR
ncbi:MAG: hypothetical protein WBG70_18415 [Spirulinaceae cyanobacterium]